MPYKDPEKRRLYHREYGREYNPTYEKLPRVKEVRRKYNKSPAGKETRQKYYYSTKGQKFHKGYRKNFYYSPKGKKYTYELRLKIKGLSVEEYNKLLNKQNGVCAICSKPPESNRRFSVDHNHKCCPGKKSCGKCIRGLLCDNCNHMLGLGKDSPEIFTKAIEYIKAGLKENA